MRTPRLLLFASLALCPWLDAQPSPVVDHHQHLFRTPVAGQTVTAAELLTLMDEARIQRAVVLSVAYQFANPNRPPWPDEEERVKAENDWTSAEVALHPDRLRGFCSVNPLEDYALHEIERCAGDPQLRLGLKLHFGNSDVDLDNAEHVARVRAIFAAANQRGMAIVVHLRPSVTRQRAYGARQARIFLDEILPAAPDVCVQIAHLGGAGGYDDPAIDEALEVFATAIRHSDPRMARVIFDVSSVAGFGDWEQRFDQIVARLRQIGIDRCVFGSDGAVNGNSPARAWADFCKLPLTGDELRMIASAVAPYLR